MDPRSGRRGAATARLAFGSLSLAGPLRFPISGWREARAEPDPGATG